MDKNEIANWFSERMCGVDEDAARVKERLRFVQNVYNRLLEVIDTIEINEYATYINLTFYDFNLYSAVRNVLADFEIDVRLPPTITAVNKMAKVEYDLYNDIDTTKQIYIGTVRFMMSQDDAIKTFGLEGKCSFKEVEHKYTTVSFVCEKG